MSSIFSGIANKQVVLNEIFMIICITCKDDLIKHNILLQWLYQKSIII